MGGGEDSGERWLRWLWEHASIFLLRPLLAILFVFSLILLSWFVAWKTVLVHVPLVQEICGLRKKPVKPKPTNLHRISRFYHSNPSLSYIREYHHEGATL
ncbi:uncharacterized protein [Elaeis guineensis]|uniref:Uncharacterized protein LOC105051830 isoform X1 n=1 Tax=Elaeis guineensis var. tenera TaxID=51953 RepID=A0A6I9RRG7_ELAGV|nr:uncharacterized protein LOC105051830 isoform X1 [Elaeis guineensis]